MEQNNWEGGEGVLFGGGKGLCYYCNGELTLVVFSFSESLIWKGVGKHCE